MRDILEATNGWANVVIQGAIGSPPDPTAQHERVITAAGRRQDPELEKRSDRQGGMNVFPAGRRISLVFPPFLSPFLSAPTTSATDKPGLASLVVSLSRYLYEYRRIFGWIRRPGRARPAGQGFLQLPSQVPVVRTLEGARAKVSLVAGPAVP